MDLYSKVLKIGNLAVVHSSTILTFRFETSAMSEKSLSFVMSSSPLLMQIDAINKSAKVLVFPFLKALPESYGLGENPQRLGIKHFHKTSYTSLSLDI